MVILGVMLLDGTVLYSLTTRLRWKFLLKKPVFRIQLPVEMPASPSRITKPLLSQAFTFARSHPPCSRSAQVKRAEEDLTAARRRHGEASKEAAALQTKIAELVLESDTAAREVKVSKRPPLESYCCSFSSSLKFFTGKT